VLATSLKTVWARKLRLLMSTFAIVLGVAFVAGSLMFTDSLGKAFTGIMNGTVGDANVRLAQESGGHGSRLGARIIPPSALEKARATDGVKQVDGVVTSISTTVLAKDGKVIGGQGAPAFGVNFHTAKAAEGAEGLHITEGRAPTKNGEIALDPKTAERGGYRIGDTVSILTTGETPRYSGKLVGFASYANGSMVGTTLAVVDTKTSQKLFLDGRDGYTSLWVEAEPGTSQDDVVKALKPTVPEGFEVVTGKQASDEAASGIQDALSFITTFLLVFAGVALLVGSFLIVNTFGILVAQRSKELALMRALGASRRQVFGGVVIEALVVGFIGSVLGIGVGVLLAKGISALLARLGAEIDTGGLTLEPRTIIVSLVIGLGVTTLAAWLPARRASRISPIAAMRDDQVEPEQTVSRRAWFGALLFVIGVALVVAQLITDSSIWVFVTGMVLMLFGTIAATPVLARPVVRGIGALARRQGVVARLAEENSLRNPRRTAATTSALMIGLALVSMMTVFGASASGSIDALIAKSFRGDFVVSGQRSEPMSQSIAPSMKKVDGVRQVSRQRYGDGTANDAPATFLAVDAASLDDVAPITVTQGSHALDDSKLLVSTDVAKAFSWKPGTQVRITVDGSRTRTVNVAGVFDKEDNDRQDDYVVTIPTFEAIGGGKKDNMLHVLVADGADRQKVQAGLEGVVKDIPTITVKDQEGYAAEQRAPIDSMLTLIYGLLGLAIVIAVLGIINTLALSVIERTREIGLLRAVGLSRRQLRSMVRLEAVTISLIGALIGVVLGTIFGVLFQRTQADSGVDVLVIPYGRLALFLVLAALVGVLAAWWPARRASKLNILSAIATE
jgi:putative ABC transport system permease protein